MRSETDTPTHDPEVFITNFNPRFTGVSATIEALYRHQAAQLRCQLVGKPLPGLPTPISLGDAIRASRRSAGGRPFSIWHVRRNAEMWAAILARDVLRLPVKTVFTSAAQRRHSAIPRWLISRMDRVIATTDEAASYLTECAAVVPHGVDTERFQPAPDRAAQWQALGYGGALGVATIGRVRPEKGTDRFVDLMIKLCPQVPGLIALIIGQAKPSDAEFKAGLEAQIAQAGLTERIVFIGEQPRESVARILPGLSALVQLPRYEGYGLTPLEAMSCAVPFVATDCGYYREFSDHGRAGQVIGHEDTTAPETLNLLTQLLNSPAQVAEMGEHGREHVERKFSIQTEADGIARVYDALWSQASSA